MRYVVIENTPGYLPDSDDPFTTDDYALAVEYLNERAAEYADDPDGNFEVEYGIASGDNLAAVIVHDRDKSHDLGRVIEILRDDLNDDPDEDAADFALARVAALWPLRHEGRASELRTLVRVLRGNRAARATAQPIGSARFPRLGDGASGAAADNEGMKTSPPKRAETAAGSHPRSLAPATPRP
jgi:hypothetical protein